MQNPRFNTTGHVLHIATLQLIQWILLSNAKLIILREITKDYNFYYWAKAKYHLRKLSQLKFELR